MGKEIQKCVRRKKVYDENDYIGYDDVLVFQVDACDPWITTNGFKLFAAFFKNYRFGKLINSEFETREIQTAMRKLYFMGTSKNFAILLKANYKEEFIQYRFDKDAQMCYCICKYNGDSLCEWQIISDILRDIITNILRRDTRPYGCDFYDVIINVLDVVCNELKMEMREQGIQCVDDDILD